MPFLTLWTRDVITVSRTVHCVTLATKMLATKMSVTDKANITVGSRPPAMRASLWSSSNQLARHRPPSFLMLNTVCRYCLLSTQTSPDYNKYQFHCQNLLNVCLMYLSECRELNPDYTNPNRA